MKSKIINYFGLLNEYLNFISFHRLIKSIIYPICIMIVLMHIIYAEIRFGYDFSFLTISAIKLFVIELIVFFTINVVIYTADYPYAILRKRNQENKINEALNIQSIEHCKEKIEIARREREIGRQQGIKENQEIIEKSFSSIVNEKDEIIKRLEKENKELSQSNKEILSDEYKSFKQSNEESNKMSKELMQRHKETIEIAEKYVLIDLEFLNLNGCEKNFIKTVVRNFVNTGFIPDKTKYKSPLINRYNIKSNLITTITRYELAHLSSNLEKFLKKGLKTIAKLCAYIFNCEEDADNICKAAKKETEEDRIILIENIEEYVKSHKNIKQSDKD